MSTKTTIDRGSRAFEQVLADVPLGWTAFAAKSSKRYAFDFEQRHTQVRAYSKSEIDKISNRVD